MQEKKMAKASHCALILKQCIAPEKFKVSQEAQVQSLVHSSVLTLVPQGNTTQAGKQERGSIPELLGGIFSSPVDLL